jgi:hypothetical protein
MAAPANRRGPVTARLGMLSRQLRSVTADGGAQDLSAPAAPPEPGSYVWPTGGLFIVSGNGNMEFCTQVLVTSLSTDVAE